MTEAPIGAISVDGRVRPWLTAIDVGLENMGIAQSYLEDGVDNKDEVMIREVLCSIHATIDGRLFEYEESQIPRLCWEWVVGFRKYWEKSRVVFIEKQFSKYNIQKERACLLIQTTLESIFISLYKLGIGPKPVCQVAVWWRRPHNLPITGDHDKNKRESIDKYKKIFGLRKYNELEVKWDKTDDVVEATLMLLVLNHRYDEVNNNLFVSNHTETQTETRIKSKDRLQELPTLAAAHIPQPGANDTITPGFNASNLRKSYKNFVSRRAESSKINSNERMYKRNHPDSVKKKKSGKSSSSSKKHRKNDGDDNIFPPPLISSSSSAHCRQPTLAQIVTQRTSKPI